MVVFPLNDPAVKEYPEKNRHRHTQRFGQHEFQLPCICSAACIFLQGSGKTLKPFRLSLETFSMALEALREGITGRWIQESKLAKTLLNTDGISNTDLRKSRNDDNESTDSCSTDEGKMPRQLGPGLFPTQDDTTYIEPSEFDYDEETLFIFDWDDTVLPSSWVQGQGLRLDESSEVLAWHREQLSQVAAAAAETLRLAKQLGTVVLITNAERGWIELSCQKFLPTLFPVLESVK
ncbi:unnamed protein product, partial [Effrenium voratum]